MILRWRVCSTLPWPFWTNPPASLKMRCLIQSWRLVGLCCSLRSPTLLVSFLDQHAFTLTFIWKIKSHFWNNSCCLYSGCCAAVLVVASVRMPQKTAALLSRDLHDSQPHVRVSAILKIQVLWKSRWVEGSRMWDAFAVNFTGPDTRYGLAWRRMVKSTWKWLPAR